MSLVEDALHDLRLLLRKPNKDIVRAAQALGVPSPDVKRAVRDEDYHGLAHAVIAKGYGDRVWRQVKIKLRRK